MRNLILISLSVFIAVVAGGFCISWFGQAQAAKTAIERAIAKLNEKQTYITYESIETSGFPSHVYVSIVKPHFTGRVDQLLQAPSMPEWNADLFLDGHMMFGINALSNRYSLQISGTSKITSNIAGQTVAAITRSAGDTVCNVELAGSSGIFGSLWDFTALAQQGDEWIKNIRLFDCANPGYGIVDMDTNQPLQSSGPSRFYINSTPQMDMQKLRIYANVTDLEVTPQGDVMMAVYRRAFSPENPYPVKYSAYGKHNLDMDFSYNGPADLEKAGKNPPLDIALNKFRLTSAVYDYAATFFLTNGMSGSERASRLAFNLEANIGEQYEALQPDAVRGAIAQLYADMNNQASAAPQRTPALDLKPYLQKYTQEELFAILYPAVPNLHSLGKIVYALDAGFRGDPDMGTGDVTLTTLELSASPYGITGKGSGKLASNRLPTGNVRLNCRNCLRMIDDMAAYAARLQKMVSAFDEEKAASMSLDPKRVEGYKNFLSALAEPGADKTSFTYTIVSDDAGPTVNRKPLEEVMALYNQYVIPAPPPAELPPPALPKQKKP